MTSSGNEKLHVRTMQESDIEQVLELEREGHAFPWTGGIFKDCLRVGYECVLAEENHEIQVYGIMSVAVNEAHIFNVCVNPKLRRQGLGIKMMKYLMTLAKKKNSQSVFLEVRPSNKPAISLYEKLGFNEVGRRKNYYPAKDGREDAVIMAREL